MTFITLVMNFNFILPRIKDNYEKTAKGENEDGARRLTDSRGDKLVSLLRPWAESTGKF